MITVFWDCEGVIVVNAMPRGERVSSDANIMTLTNLRKRFKLVRPQKNPTQILYSASVDERSGEGDRRSERGPGAQICCIFFFNFF
jgi:hypothetical protein